jgi:hypothetical protein
VGLGVWQYVGGSRGVAINKILYKMAVGGLATLLV